MSESSGESTRSALTPAAWLRNRLKVSTFWAKPPTTAFIWARASRMTGTPRAYRRELTNLREMIHTRLTEQRYLRRASNKTGGGRVPRAMPDRKSHLVVSGRVHLD